MEYQNNGNLNNTPSRGVNFDTYSSIGKSYNDLSLDEKDTLISILKDELDSKWIKNSTSMIS